MTGSVTSPTSAPIDDPAHRSSNAQNTGPDTAPVLISASNVKFSVPVVLPQERSILKNPFSLVSDFYLNKQTRQFHTLLDGISFTLREGGKLGIIGHNGAGKTTLLRMLGGIYQPTSGELKIDCVPLGLFDVSHGFIQDATGLENIYLRGLEIGMSMAEVLAEVPRIIEFSGLGDNIDKPFRTFSSGMRLRLSVAVALSVQPEVMLLDEWIGSGDATFKSKVAARMRQLVGGARGLILASHNDDLLREICTHGIVMRKGQIVYNGKLDDALAYYHEHKTTNALPAADRTMQRPRNY